MPLRKHQKELKNIIDGIIKKGGGYMKALDLAGQRFGKLLAIKRVEKRQKGKILWECLCDCGNTTHSCTANLIHGRSQSCGCVRTKHLGKGSRLYRIWSGMKDRCLNTKSKYWKQYGGRGIAIYKEWAEDFAIFRVWAMQTGYSKELQIDRENNDSGYHPENCRWVTAAVNSRNRRTSKLTEEKVCKIKTLLKNPTVTTVELSKAYCVTRATLCDIKNGRTWRDIQCP